MKSVKILTLFVFALVFITTSCTKEETVDNTQNINLNLDGLTNLGSDFVYEGWIMVDGTPVTTGTFTVNDNGDLSTSVFSLDKTSLTKATKFILTIEPKSDTDPKPSNTKYLVGDFNGNTANVNTSIVGDFSNATGDYILATPTDGASSNENSGIWWVDPSGAAPVAGLSLPSLPNGWKYEGWVVIGGVPVSTGTFVNVSATDELAPYSGSSPLPSPNGGNGFFPGEDFLINPPSGLSFPTDIAGGTAVISIEPFPDNNSKPFKLKPLVGAIPASAADHTKYSMDTKSDFPKGTVSR